jgi:hypothetical protein
MAKEARVVGHGGLEGKRNSDFSLLLRKNIETWLTWCEQWWNEVNECIKRGREPLVPLGQVRWRAMW